MLICVSAVFRFRQPVGQFICAARWGALHLLIFAALLTSGNGFLHYQYNPSWRVRAIAMPLTIIGFAGIVMINRRLRREIRLALISEDAFYAFMFVTFVLLPTIYGEPADTESKILTSLLIWLPFLLISIWYLCRRHPLERKRGDAA